MTLDLNSIPDSDTHESSAPAEKTAALSGLGSLAKRRTVLRGIALSGATIGAVALGWSPLGRSTGEAHAETSNTGLTGWDAIDCKDAYPNGYAEEKDDTGIYQSEPAACYGGYHIGSTLCDNYGWHRADWYYLDNTTVREFRPISSACGATTTKNAWRWTVNGTTYRCSDGVMTHYTQNWWGGWRRGYSYLTICRAKV